MFTSIIRCSVLCCLMGLLPISHAAAQDFILPYVKTPETAQEFWAAVKYEVELGNHRRVAAMLEKFWEKLAALPEADQSKLLLALYDADGMSAFLRLGNIPEVRKLTAKDADGKDAPLPDVLMSKVSKVVTARLSDPKRIAFFVGNLSKSPEERAYAISQLRQAGPRAVPLMVNILLDDARRSEHDGVILAWQKMNSDIGPPLLAAMDADKPYLQSVIISLFLQRADDRIVPHLWFVFAGSEAPELRKQAAESLSTFLRFPAEELRNAKAALIREAERYYRHEAELPPGDQQIIWRWSEQNELASRTVSRSQFEEQEGVYWAQKALKLDPASLPAQVVLLSIVLEKAYERGGFEQPLTKTSPEIHQLLISSGSGLLEAVLERALSDGRTTVAVGAARALAPTGDWRLVRSSNRELPPLVRALSYPDRRVQLAAADAILRIPMMEPFAGSSRVVEVLRRALASDAMPKALIALASSAEAQKLSALIRGFGLEPVVAQTGREAIRLANQTGDIEVIFLDPRLPDPTFPYSLSQLRVGPDAAGIPIVVWTPADQERTVRPLAQRYPRVLVLSPPPVSAELLKHELDPFLKGGRQTPLTDAERKLQTRVALEWIGRIARGEVTSYDLRPAEAAILRALDKDELAKEAAEIIGHRAGIAAQSALADLALNKGRPAPVRTEAAKQVRLHFQRYGILLKPEQTAGLSKLPASAEDPILAEEAARLSAALQSDAAVAGNRLKQFQPVLVKPTPTAN